MTFRVFLLFLTESLYRNYLQATNSLKVNRCRPY